MERHPNSARFHALLGEAGEMHDRKQQDYGKGSDPFANVRASEELGIPGWAGAVLRMNDKQVRLAKAVRDTLNTGQPRLANEGVQDTFMDMAVYALIGYVLYEEWTPSNDHREALQRAIEGAKQAVADNLEAASGGMIAVEDLPDAS